MLPLWLASSALAAALLSTTIVEEEVLIVPDTAFFQERCDGALSKVANSSEFASLKADIDALCSAVAARTSGGQMSSSDLVSKYNDINRRVVAILAASQPAGGEN